VIFPAALSRAIRSKWRRNHPRHQTGDLVTSKLSRIAEEDSRLVCAKCLSEPRAQSPSLSGHLPKLILNLDRMNREVYRLHGTSRDDDISVRFVEELKDAPA